MLKDQAAVITGGSSGIGKSVVVSLLENGCRVVIADIDEIKGGQVISEFSQKFSHMLAFSKCDVTKAEDLHRSIELCIEKFGRFDIMMNNAGIGESKDFRQGDLSWRKVLEIDLTAVILGSQIAYGHMKKLGNGGHIINTASMAGLIPIPMQPVYTAAKTGVVGVTEALSRLYDPDNIRVNCICPSFTDTPLIYQGGKDNVSEMKQLIGGLIDPKMIADGVMELCLHPEMNGKIMRLTLQKGIDYHQSQYTKFIPKFGLKSKM